MKSIDISAARACEIAHIANASMLNAKKSFFIIRKAFDFSAQGFIQRLDRKVHPPTSNHKWTRIDTNQNHGSNGYHGYSSGIHDFVTSPFREHSCHPWSPPLLSPSLRANSCAFVVY